LLHGLDGSDETSVDNGGSSSVSHGSDDGLDGSDETSVDNGGSSSVRDGSDDTSVKTKAGVDTVKTKAGVDTVETETSVDTVETETGVELGPDGEDTPEDAGCFHHV